VQELEDFTALFLLRCIDFKTATCTAIDSSSFIPLLSFTLRNSARVCYNSIPLRNSYGCEYTLIVARTV
jgi:hypothetical protein